MVGEEELRRPSAAGVWYRAPGRACGDDTVDQAHRLVIERHHPLGVELAERHLEPGAVAWHLMDTVELQVPTAGGVRSLV
jgi:hypothetical protein